MNVDYNKQLLKIMFTVWNGTTQDILWANSKFLDYNTYDYALLESCNLKLLRKNTNLQLQKSISLFTLPTHSYM